MPAVATVAPAVEAVTIAPILAIQTTEAAPAIRPPTGAAIRDPLTALSVPVILCDDPVSGITPCN